MDQAELDEQQRDRAAGVLLGVACGDALGAGYEFAPPRINGEPIGMVGGGAFGWEPGEWTDDTAMTLCIAEVAATGVDLRSTAGLDAITAAFVAWAASARDVGIQTRGVLSAVAGDPTAAAAADAAAEAFARTGSTGNGALMRTAPVALAYLHDTAARDRAAHAISALTHADTESGEACALWCSAIAHAVRHGDLTGLRLAVDRLPADRARLWHQRLDDAERVRPHEIPANGWVVAAMLAAWSAITTTHVPRPDTTAGITAHQHLAAALESAVRAGHDTDTVAAIAGGLLGARWGAAAVPQEWLRIVHGWPGMRAPDLVRLGLLIVGGGRGAMDPRRSSTG